MVQLAALGASVLGRFAHFPATRLQLLVACGAAAGIAAAYNAPIASAFFVSEIVLGAIVMKNFGPVVVASVVSNITMRGLPGYTPVLAMPEFPDISGVEIPLFVVLGLAAGILAPQFLRLLHWSRERFRGTGLPLPVRLGLGKSYRWSILELAEWVEAGCPRRRKWIEMRGHSGWFPFNTR